MFSRNLEEEFSQQTGLFVTFSKAFVAGLDIQVTSAGWL
jgi:hypothetical protein